MTIDTSIHNTSTPSRRTGLGNARYLPTTQAPGTELGNAPNFPTPAPRTALGSAR
jgi:hypothetical protein